MNTKKQITQEEANRMQRAAIEKAAREAREEVKDLDRKILELHARRAQAEADATRLNKLVVRTWGMGE
jgi:transcription-repair coupling factor (superfamily II helicase)